MRLINLTPHNVNIIDDDGKCKLTIQPTSPPARCNEHYTKDDASLAFWPDVGKEKYLFTAIPIETGTLSYRDVKDLPPSREETYYIVSVLVAQQRPGRDDLLVPYDLVRKDGQIIGCKRLVRIS